MGRLLVLAALGWAMLAAGRADAIGAVGFRAEGTLRARMAHRDPGDGSKVLVFVEYELVTGKTTYVLDFGKAPDLRGEAARLKGQRVAVTGNLHHRRLTVTALAATSIEPPPELRDLFVPLPLGVRELRERLGGERVAVLEGKLERVHFAHNIPAGTSSRPELIQYVHPVLGFRWVLNVGGRTVPLILEGRDIAALALTANMDGQRVAVVGIRVGETVHVRHMRTVGATAALRR